MMLPLDNVCLLIALIAEFCVVAIARRYEAITQTSGDYGYWNVGTSAPCVGSAACGRLFNDTVILEQYNDQVPCVAEGYFQYPINWHGYLVKATLPGDRVGRLYYHIVYPEDKCCIKLLLYTKRQVAELRAKTMSCLQRQAVLDPRERQVISLSPHSNDSGCSRNVTADGRRVIDCYSGLNIQTKFPQTWNVAVSSCGSPTGLDFRYAITIYGHEGECIPGDVAHASMLCSQLLLITVSIVLSLALRER